MGIRIGLVGCGDIVRRYYLPALAQLQREGKISLAACCDVDGQKAQAAAGIGFERVYTDCLKMLEEIRPDGVLMALPVEKTAEWAMRAAPYGIPLMLEKPPALTKESALLLAETLKKYSVLHQVAFNRHFIPVAVALKEKLKKETVRDIQIQMCRINRVEQTFYTTAVHCIDLLRFLSGGSYEQVDFSYQDLPEYGPHVSNFYLQCRFSNGVAGQIAILVDSGIVNERVMVSCKGTAYFAALPVWECSDSPGGIVIYQGDKVADTMIGPAVGNPLCNAVASGFYGEIAHFVNAVARQRQPEESMESAVELIEIAEALHNRREVYRNC